MNVMGMLVDILATIKQVRQAYLGLPLASDAASGYFKGVP
jgi:hypothetical protein